MILALSKGHSGGGKKSRAGEKKGRGLRQVCAMRQERLMAHLPGVIKLQQEIVRLKGNRRFRTGRGVEMTNSVFEQHGPKTPEVSTKPHPYIAYGLSMPMKVDECVNIYRIGNPVFRIEDTKLADFLVGEDYVTLIYNKCMIELRGRNLLALEELTRHYVINFVDTFDPRFHIPPAAHEPLIEGIRWKTVLKTEARLVPNGKYKSDAWQVRME
jgi:hypothetical protein